MSWMKSALLVLVVLFTAGFVYFKYQASDPYGPVLRGLLWPPPAPLEPFELVATDGAAVTEATLTGKWTLLAFTHVRCGAPCAATLAALRAASRDLQTNVKFAAAGQLWLVSVDAAADLPQGLRNLVSEQLPGALAATAEPLALHLFARQFALDIVKSSGAEPGDYTLNYAQSIFLIDPQLRVVAEFVPPHEPDSLGRQVAQVISFVTTGL